MLHCLRAIGVTQPNWVLFENVPGLLNSNGGDDFEACLTTFSELGYSVAWRVLDARHFGLAQRRRRLWLIAQRGRCPDGPAEILALRDCKGGVPAAGGTLWQTPTRRSEGCNEELASEAEVDWSDFVSWMMPTDSAPPKPASGAENPLDAVYAVDLDECTMSATETQTLRKGGSAPSLILQSADGVQVRRCTPLECLRLQGFDDNWLDGVKFGGKLLSDSARYQLIGNSWPVPVAAWILERLLGNMGSLPDGTRLSATPTCAHPDQGMHQSSTKLRTTKPRTSPDRPRH
jgi:DNA (cytosine-5)-methyltransferase 1